MSKIGNYVLGEIENANTRHRDNEQARPHMVLWDSLIDRKERKSSAKSDAVRESARQKHRSSWA